MTTGSVAKRRQYVTPLEIGRLLEQSGRLVMVYQHIRAQRARTRVDRVIAAVEEHVGRVSWATYESGTVAMLCFSRDNVRTAGFATHFRNSLGRHADGRVQAKPFST